MAGKTSDHKGWGGAGRGQGRTAAAAEGPVTRRNVTLDDASADILRKTGDGDLSRGIRIAAQTLRADTHGIVVSMAGDKCEVVNGYKRLVVLLQMRDFAHVQTTTGETVRVELDADGELRCVAG